MASFYTSKEVNQLARDPSCTKAQAIGLLLVLNPTVDITTLMSLKLVAEKKLGWNVVYSQSSHPTALVSDTTLKK